MGATEGETAVADSRPSEEPESAPAQETLQVPTQKRRKLKSPTPLSLRGRSATPVHGRSQTPFTLYMTRRSATPSSWRSITPFLKREEREKTPFELGKDIRTLITCNTAVFDRALIMDITEPEDIQKPVRYITSDVSVIDRAAVMDVSNVEVIYVVEEYEEYEEEEELIEEVKPKKKSKGRKGKTPRKSAEKEQSPSRAGSLEQDFENDLDIEDGLERDEREETPKKGKKKAAPKKKEKKEKSPSPQLTLKLELGGGSKANKKMFEQQEQKMPAGPKPPPKKSKLVLQIEEQARAAAKAAEEEAAKLASKQKSETFEERQKRLQKEKEEKERLEAELRAAEAEAQAEAEAEARAEAELEDEEGESGGEEGEDGEDGEFTGEEGDGASRYDEDADENGSHNADNENDDVEEEADEVPELPKGNEKRRGSEDEYTKFEDDECWKRIAEEEGEEFMQQLRKYSIAQRRSEKERDADWQRKREQARHPHFIAFLTDRTVQTGQNVRLACAVGGPELSVKWFKDGRQIERDATHRIVNNNNILILEILNTTILDSGEYACVISNLNDEVTSSCYVTIYEIFKDEPQSPSFRLIRDYYHLRDDELTIEVHLHGVPRPIVSWWRDAFEIKPNFKFTMLEEAHGVYKLLIYKPTNRDSGAYICKALNSSGEAQTSHIVEVAKNRHFHVPGIFHGRNRILQEKEVAAKRAMEEALQSKAESDKKRALAAGDEPKVKGHYRASPEPLVSPKQKLRFATQLRDRMALEGTKVRFICTVIGPEPTCRWMKDDKWVVVGGNIKNLSEEGKAILELSKVTNESSGVYKCVAKNEHSEIETSCYFKVYSAQTDGDEQEPIFALPLRDVYHSSQNDLIIDTKVRGNPRPTISWLKDNIPVVLDERKVQIEHLDGLCELIINKPAPSDGGVYTCVAENKLGNQKITHTVVFDVVQTSRRSSALSNTMPEVENSGSSASRATKEGGDDENKKPPKPKRKDDAEAEVTYERRSRMPDPSPKQQLYFIANLSNRYIAEGSKVKLQAVIGGPDATIKWLKNDQNVAYGPRIRNMNRDNLAVLEILKALPEDSGTYSILAQNEFCKISTTALLHVYQPKVNSDVQPTFIRSLKDTYHLNTNELILETAVRGQPTPEVQWFKDSVEIARSEKYQILEHQDGTCELIIDKPENRDSGKYTVRAENREGKMEISHYVLFEGKEHHIADNIHGVFHADPSLLRSRITEVDKPAATGEEKAESDTDDGKGKRRSRKTKESDKEEEEVVAPSTEASNVKEKKREKVIGIHFATNMKDRVVAEGSKVKISCFLEAKEPQVKWFKNGEQIANSPKMRGRYSEGLCLLDIASATLADSGEYQCVAQDETGKASTSCKLEIYANPGTGDVPPTFTRNIKDTLNAKINELHLDVHVRGLPTPTISWIKDGVKIENSEKYQLIDHDDGTCELFISNPVNADNGKYVCQAENREGKSEITHMVTVEPRRTRPSSPQREARPPTKPPTDEGSGEKETKRKKPKDDEEEAESSRREVPPPPDLRKRLYFRNFLTNRTVQAGSNVKWVVNIDGPDPTARWFHGEQPIAFGPKSKLACQDGIAFLNLIGVKEEDAGEYTLKVKGAENEIISKCDLFVYSVGKEQLIAPVFTVGIKESYQSHSNHIVLECKVSGNPNPRIYWHKDNTLLSTANSKFEYIELSDGIKQIIVQNPTKADSGLYTCYAENEFGQMKISKFLDVADHMQSILCSQKRASQVEVFFDDKTQQENAESSIIPRRQSKDDRFVINIESQTKPLTISTGNKAQLICCASGLIEEVYWLREQERVTKDARHKIYSINGVLSLDIYDTRLDDSGQYTCVVRNSRNSTECSCQLSVYDESTGKLPSSFSSSITASFDVHRNELILYCHIYGRPRVTWLKDDHTISNNRYRQIDGAAGERKLIIRNPISSDCGTFLCCAETEETREVITKTVKMADLKRLMMQTSTGEENDDDNRERFRLARHSETETQECHSAPTTDQPDQQQSVKPRPRSDRTKPLFSTLSCDRNVSEGSSVKFVCNVTGGEDTEVVWLKNHERISDDVRFQTLYHDSVASLHIFSAELKDNGNYICRATNEYGESNTHAYLRVYKPFESGHQALAFTRSIQDVYSLNENELVLDCRIRGKPLPEIQWMKGSDLITNNEKYQQIDQADGYAKLIIRNPTERDSGLYSCVATNEAGESKLSHQVDFVGRERFTLQKTHGFFHRDPNKPHFVAPLGDQTVCPGGTAAISAEFLQTNSPIDVQWIRNRQILSGQPNIKTFMDRGVYTLAIQNATPEIEGTYTCRASNAFGRIESHVNVDVTVGAPKNERPPLFLSRPDTEMKIAVGDPFSVSFRISGDPKPKLTFMKGTKDITKSDRVVKEAMDDFIRFTVHKSQISDSGTYFVVARNNFGTDRVFVTVTVMPRARSETPTLQHYSQLYQSSSDVAYFRDPPGPVSSEPLAVDSGPSHISLSWGKSVSANSAPVVAYRVDAWMMGHEGGAVWKELGLTPINSFDAFNLKPHVKYHFRITPRNRYGWGPSVQTSSPLQVGGVESLPEFIKILPGQVKALLGSQFALECIVRGAPRPVIVWYKDSARLSSNSERIRIKQVGSNCTLLISQVCATDVGRYTCEATNSKGCVSTFARLQVVSDRKLFEADGKLKEIVRCEESSSKLGESLPIFTMRLRDRRVQVSYPVRLTCQVVSCPAPTVTWYKEDQELCSDRSCVISSDGQFYTLELISTSLEDSGVYSCTAKNEMGSVSCHCTLVVDKGIRAYIAPDFYTPLDPLYIFEEGQEIRLSAKVEAYPAIGVSWYRNGLKLRPSRKVLATLDSSGFVELIIADATQRDAGIYLCEASNAVGKAESTCQVSVKQAMEDKKEHKIPPAVWTTDLPYSKEPMFVVKPRSSEAYEGDTVIIFCEVVGDPKPEVVWLRDFLNPEYYKDAPHFRRVGEGPEYRLEIPSAKLDFTGSYSVIATNCHGEAKAVISLQIYAKDILKKGPMEKGSIRHGNIETLPYFVRHLRNLRCCDGDAITLECHVEAVPEPVIIWEKDGRVLCSGKEFITSYNGIKATLSISRVYPEDEGEYTCVAKNNIGRTLSSACIIVDQPEEKENMLHRQLARPMGLLSANSTPRSTPRSTPARSISPMRLSHRRSSADLHRIRRSSLDRGVSLNQAISAPKFYSIPHSRVVEEGDSVRFQCTISGNPMPWSTWDKDGRIVTPTTRISIKDVDDLRFLEIDEVTFDDAGLYRVTLENDYGRIETTARLDVIGSSRYSKSPSGRGIRSSSSKRKAYFYRRIMGPSTAIGGRMALAAGFRGSSVPSCNFYHNGVLLQESERVHIEIVNQQEVQLIVERVTKADEGVYTCVLETPEDDQLASSLIVCFHNPKEISSIRKGPRIIQELPLTQQSDEGETADLSFELECEEPYSYTWTKNGEVLPDSPEFNYIDHGNGVISLRIHGVYDVDSGQYSCIITTSDGSTCSTSGELNIIQCSRDSGIDNSDENVLFLKPPLPAITRFGGEATFCAKVHPRDVDVEWSVCGRKVEESAVDFRLESSKADGLRFLHIRNVDYSHSGEVLLSIISPDRKAPAVRAYSSLLVLPVPVYTSRYSPDQNFIYSSIPGSPNHLLCEQFEKELLVPAYILDGPADCTVLIGGSVTLSVRFEGLPQPDVKWFKAGRPIAKQRNISICTQNNCSTLSIDDIAADDSGKYTVEIMNELNAVTAAASVAVEGPPEPPSGRPSISQGPDRIAVAWCGPPYDGGCILTGFQIEMQQAPKARNNEGDDFSHNDGWLQIALVSDSLAYTVKNLSAENIYRFRVRAVNVHGCSAPGSVSDWVALKSPEVTTEDFQSKPICVESGGDFKSRFEILEELGKGRFGIVYKVLEKGDSAQILAAKVVKCIKARDRQKVQDEISIMRSLKHPKLLRLAAIFESPREIIMVMEYITGGELFERVVADDFTLTERDCILFLRQVCGGVAYMHSRSIVHLDLKPENIMCHTRTSHQIKIIDFGLAQRLNTNTPVRVLFGTPEFIPPEVINYEPIGFQSDMWSVGVICYVLLSGLSPFMGDTDAETFANITRADYDFEDEAFDSVSQEAKDFISNLLVHRKEKRWTAQECLESKWLTQGLDEHSNYNRICTDKLKKFIIRRKWQKTGNAIRALGRMATLSASRRNSLISTAGGSLPSSPRPSISGINIFSPNLSAHMSSLNEEEDDFNVELPSLDLNKMHIKAVLKTHIKSECNERSDSGFSESSSFSGFGISSSSCVHSSAPVAELEAINPPVADLDSEKAFQLSVLKTKLDQIATQSEQKEEAVELNAVVNDNNNDAETLKIDKFQTDAAEKSASEITNGLTVSPAADLNNESHATDTRSSPVSSPGASPGRQLSPIRKTLMRSDFTNTIQMRKKSLENNLSREKAKPTKSVFEQPGKVSRLKNKFNNFPGQQDDSMKPSPCKSVLSRLPCDRKTKLTAKLSSTSVPASPLPERSATPSRLSARVREATERLSSQHTVTSAKRAESRRALTHTKS